MLLLNKVQRKKYIFQKKKTKKLGPQLPSGGKFFGSDSRVCARKGWEIGGQLSSSMNCEINCE